MGANRNRPGARPVNPRPAPVRAAEDMCRPTQLASPAVPGATHPPATPPDSSGLTAHPHPIQRNPSANRRTHRQPERRTTIPDTTIELPPDFVEAFISYANARQLA